MKMVGRLAQIALLSLPLTLFAQSQPADEKKKEEQPVAKAAAAPQDSALVAAAKKAPVKRDKEKLRIDNTTVKKSAGKLTIAPPRPKPRIAPEDTAQARIAKHDRELRDWQNSLARAQSKVDALTKEITTLEASLGRFEEDFYNEDDPAYRETLEGQYGSAEERIKAAREELLQAQTELTQIENSKPRIY
jgi:predicted  nucleic acid-binding Zn-ribbon protein